METLFTNDRMWFSLQKEVLEWIQTPYAHLQAIKGKGADCGLFIAKSLENIGILNRPKYDYFPRFALRKLNKNVLIENICLTIEKFFCNGYSMQQVFDSDFVRGDLLTFNLRSRVPNHMALYFGNDLLIHSIDRRGVEVIPFKDIYKKRLKHKYRIYEWE